MAKKSRTVTIREDQAEWLDNNPGVNLSGLVRQTIDEWKESLDSNGGSADNDDQRTI